MNEDVGTINTENVQSHLMRNRHCMLFESFKRAGCRKWVQVSLNDLEGTCGPQSSASFQQNGESTTLRLDEIESLILVLKTQRGKEAITETRKSLTAAQLDAEISRFAPWVGVILDMFNSNEFKSTCRFDGFGHLNEVDPSYSPVLSINGGSMRMEFNYLRPKFSMCH